MGAYRITVFVEWIVYVSEEHISDMHKEPSESVEAHHPACPVVVSINKGRSVLCPIQGVKKVLGRL